MEGSFDLPVKIRSLLKLATGLIEICYDCRSGAGEILADESFDFGQASDQLVELRDVLEKLFKKTMNKGAHSLGTGLPVDAVNGLLSRCMNEISEMDAALKQESGRKRIKGPSSSFNLQVILTDLASSTTALRDAMDANRRSSSTIAENSVIPVNHNFIDSRHSNTYNVNGNQHIYNFSAGGDAERQKIRAWLSAPDPSSNHHDAVKKRGPETGLWLINGKLLRDWKIAAHSFAWIYGIPGCGKSVLCSTIIQDVAIHCKENTSFALAYFYFDFTDPNKQKSSSLIRSFLTQLSFQSLVCPKILRKLHAQCQGGSQQASTTDLMDALKTIIGSFHHTYLVIDALDECSDQEELLAVLKEIADWKLHSLHVLATSQHKRYIEEHLTQIVSSHTSLDGDLVDEDIRYYISTTLVKDSRFRIWTAAERQETEDSLMQRAHGMFRWVTCQLDVLAKCSSLHQLRKALHTLPTTLEETYDRILRCISNEHRGTAVRLLQWLAFSARPLALAEIAEVFAVDRDEDVPRYDPDQRLRDPRVLLDTCSSLITVAYDIPVQDDRHLFDPRMHMPGSVRQSGILALAHLSVKEYLISERIRNSSLSYYYLGKGLADSAISRECLAYLLHFDTDDCLCDQSETKISFGRYAAEFWVVHARAGNVLIQDDAQSLAARLFSLQSAHFKNWITLFDADNGYRHDQSELPEDVPHPLYYASLLGLAQIVNQLVLSGLVDLNLIGGDHGSALASASAEGHKEIVQILLEKGADVNLVGGNYGSTLASASFFGQEEIVQILLEKGAVVNMVGGGYYGSALATASVQGHEKIVQTLLAKGADVNMVVGDYGSFLASASVFGEQEIVRILLEKGAEVNMIGGTTAVPWRLHRLRVTKILCEFSSIGEQMRT